MAVDRLPRQWSVQMHKIKMCILSRQNWTAWNGHYELGYSNFFSQYKKNKNFNPNFNQKVEVFIYDKIARLHDRKMFFL